MKSQGLHHFFLFSFFFWPPWLSYHRVGYFFEMIIEWELEYGFFEREQKGGGSVVELGSVRIIDEMGIFCCLINVRSQVLF